VQTCALPICDVDVPAPVREVVSEGDELADYLFVFDLGVGERRGISRAPVDDPLASVDQPLPIHLDERRADGPSQTIVHGEPQSGPVTGAAKLLDLFDDRVSVLLLPRPHAF